MRNTGIVFLTHQTYTKMYLYFLAKGLLGLSKAEPIRGVLTYWGWPKLSQLEVYLLAGVEQSWANQRCTYLLGLTKVEPIGGVLTWWGWAKLSQLEVYLLAGVEQRRANQRHVWAGVPWPGTYRRPWPDRPGCPRCTPASETLPAAPRLF